jgi:dTDP-4-dehydrorhamnose 3,5-epimerase
MDIRTFDIEGPILLTPRKYVDARGSFSETFRQDVFEAAAGAVRFVQDNHSHSVRRGTLRGLHYQAPPHAQGKLVRVVRGEIFDVVVDIRHGSPSFGRHVSVVLNAAAGSLFWVPPGFLHGFLTLTDDAEVIYRVSDYYSPECEGAVAFDDPDLGVQWPLDGAQLSISDKDRHAPRLRDLPPIFSLTA